MRVRQSQRSLRVFQRDNFTCRYCGGKVKLTVPEDDPLRATVDHVIPRSRGGTDQYENLVTAHFQCNQLKANGSAPPLLPVHARIGGPRIGDPLTRAPSDKPRVSNLDFKPNVPPRSKPQGEAFRQSRWRFPPPRDSA